MLTSSCVGYWSLWTCLHCVYMCWGQDIIRVIRVHLTRGGMGYLYLSCYGSVTVACNLNHHRAIPRLKDAMWFKKSCPKRFLWQHLWSNTKFLCMYCNQTFIVAYQQWRCLGRLCVCISSCSPARPAAVWLENHSIHWLLDCCPFVSSYCKRCLFPVWCNSLHKKIAIWNRLLFSELLL